MGEGVEDIGGRVGGESEHEMMGMGDRWKGGRSSETAGLGSSFQIDTVCVYLI